VLLQDFTGVPCVVDLVAMHDAMAALSGDPAKINLLIPAEQVIDHSVIADVFARPDGLGVLGWGDGGIEAETAMLGQPMSMLIPQVLGIKLTG
jgi:aconitase A